MIITIKTAEKIIGKAKADKLENLIIDFIVEGLSEGEYEIWSKDIVRKGEVVLSNHSYRKRY
jgi:hypothetical protein